MIRTVCVFLLLLGATAVLSASTISGNLPSCPTVKPSNTSVEKILGDWYLHEISVVTRIPQVQLCNKVEIADIRTSETGQKSFNFLLYKIQNGTQRLYVFNKTLDISSVCPGHWITREKDGYTTLVAQTDNKKLICIVTPRSDEKVSTFILSREENPEASDLQTIKERVKTAGVVTDGNVITRDGTLCNTNT